MNTLTAKKIFRGFPPTLSSSDTISLDLELSGLKDKQLHRPNGKLVSLAGCFDGENVYIIFDQDEVQEFLNAIQDATWVFHNATFDLGHLRRWATIPERKNMRDTMLIEKLMWANFYEDFKLNDLVRRYLNCYMAKDIRKEFIDLDAPMTQEQIEYAALDVVGTWLVDQEQQKIISDTDKAIWNSLYNPHVWTTLELSGFKLNVGKWRDLAERNQKIIDEIAEKLGRQYGTTIQKVRHEKRKPAIRVKFDDAGNELPMTDAEIDKLRVYAESEVVEDIFVPFNPSSHSQVLKILNSSGISVESTGDDEIRPYYETNEFVKDVLDYRKSEKQVTTYGLNFLKNVEPDDRIYTSLNIGKAITGRDCIHGDTIISTSLGDFAVSDLPLTALGSCSILTHTGNKQKILRKIYKGTEEMFEVTLDNGSKIKCTKGHKFLTAEGWKHLHELKENDRLLDPPLPNRGTKE